MRAVLISIRPEWVDKILTGEKTLEVRKTRPNLGTPFQCYIYCTKGRKPWVLDGFPGIRQDGNVVAEFTCDKITRLTHVGFMGDPRPAELAAIDGKWGAIAPEFDFSKTCLSIEQIEKYLVGGNGYAWHISNLKIYGKPKPLGNFTKLKITRFWTSEENITRPPQSWCYLEGLENGENNC